MSRPTGLFLALSSAFVLMACASSEHTHFSAGPQALRSSPEEIYVVRSIRTQHLPPGDVCAPNTSGFSAHYEDDYEFWSVATRAADGKVLDAHASQIGTLRGCFDRVADQPEGNFYGEGAINGIGFHGTGKCTVVARDSPAAGMLIARCFLALTDLTGGYTSGLLTTNSLNSAAGLGDKSDPPGYTQVSIATVRVWR